MQCRFRFALQRSPSWAHQEQSLSQTASFLDQHVPRLSRLDISEEIWGGAQLDVIHQPAPEVSLVDPGVGGLLMRVVALFP